MKFIPVLDIGVVWDPESGSGFTEVYRKPTTSEIVMSWNDFGPTDWKTGTLVGFIKRAYTHSSDFMIMHHEITRIKSPFRKVGYPLWLTQDKINKTLANFLYNIFYLIRKTSQTFMAGPYSQQKIANPLIHPQFEA